MKDFETICAVSTPAGVGGIAVIRISGKDVKTLCDKLLRNRKGERLGNSLKADTARYCCFYDGEMLVDEVVATFFASPHSYTGDDTVEISCHGSLYVQQKILETLVKNGARLAEAGEFTMRAFINGKLDLSQAEAVADLIDSKSEAAHRIAINQMRGGFSKKLSQLRQQFVELSALLELELDFSDEDVEFADRNNLKHLVQSIEKEVESLVNSFREGNAIKNGVPVAIVGEPNAGKSTLLNTLLGDERAIVSDIPGTTRDTIEDTVVIDGITFRFIDTAGIRNSNDPVEKMGIERSRKAIGSAEIVLVVGDSQKPTENMATLLEEAKNEAKKCLLVVNKMDTSKAPKYGNIEPDSDCYWISALYGKGIEELKQGLVSRVKIKGGENDVILTNVRHYEAMCKIIDTLKPVKEGLASGVAGDLLMVDIRQALYYIGLITGEVSSDEVLGTIFSRFCVGK